MGGISVNGHWLEDGSEQHLTDCTDGFRDGSKGKPLREERCSQAYIHGYETALNEESCRAGLSSESVAVRCEKWNRIVCKPKADSA